MSKPVNVYRVKWVLTKIPYEGNALILADNMEQIIRFYKEAISIEQIGIAQDLREQ